MMSEFEKAWDKAGLDDRDLKNLQLEILTNPEAGKVVKGTGGLRKIRFATEGKGKSGGLRILYVDFVAFEKIYLITAYQKGKKDNLSASERGKIKELIEALEQILKRRWY